MTEQNFLSSHLALHSKPEDKSKQIIPCWNNLMAVCKLNSPKGVLTVPETVELTWVFTTRHARFLTDSLHPRWKAVNILSIYCHWLRACFHLQNHIYLLQFCEKQVDIVHRVYLPDKVFCIFQKYLKRVRVLLLLFWKSTLGTRANSKTFMDVQEEGNAKSNLCAWAAISAKSRTGSTTYSFEPTALFQWIPD